MFFPGIEHPDDEIYLWFFDGERIDIVAAGTATHVASPDAVGSQEAIIAVLVEGEELVVLCGVKLGAHVAGFAPHRPVPGGIEDILSAQAGVAAGAEVQGSFEEEGGDFVAWGIDLRAEVDRFAIYTFPFGGGVIEVEAAKAALLVRGEEEDFFSEEFSVGWVFDHVFPVVVKAGDGAGGFPGAIAAHAVVYFTRIQLIAL